MQDERIIFETNLKKFLRKKGWSRKKLAHELGISYVTLHTYFSAPSLPPKVKRAIELMMEGKWDSPTPNP